ncbi:MAG: hypothetical protein J6V72_11885 [Kiritimatiellae bacterium]|nr:hypothetical protein [Kiritimatiellia bacterium]
MKAICPVCGKEFTSSVEGHARRTKLCCSSACKWKRINRIRNGQPVAETEYRAFCEKRKAARLAKLQRVCPVCGKEFAADPCHLGATYCSKSCSNRARATSMAVGRNVSASKARNAAPNITFIHKSEPQERSSIARVEAYLSLPAAERWARRDTLTKKEQAMAGARPVVEDKVPAPGLPLRNGVLRGGGVYEPTIEYDPPEDEEQFGKTISAPPDFYGYLDSIMLPPRKLFRLGPEYGIRDAALKHDAMARMKYVKPFKWFKFNRARKATAR